MGSNDSSSLHGHARTCVTHSHTRAHTDSQHKQKQKPLEVFWLVNNWSVLFLNVLWYWVRYNLLERKNKFGRTRRNPQQWQWPDRYAEWEDEKRRISHSFEGKFDIVWWGQRGIRTSWNRRCGRQGAILWVLQALGLSGQEVAVASDGRKSWR